VRVIEHRHRVAAVAADRVYYAAHIEVLEPDHHERRFVAALCLYSHAVDTGRTRGLVYDQEEAERFARALLMPAEAFAPVAGRSDTELAELFVARLDQVAIRRHASQGRRPRLAGLALFARPVVGARSVTTPNATSWVR
jgi:hypothetical protein